MLGPGKIQKKVQTQLKIQGAIHIRNDSRRAYNFVSSYMRKTECAVECFGEVIMRCRMRKLH